MDKIQSGYRVLILFAHPALQRSRVNRSLILGIDNLPGVTFHDLYELYPDFDIDIETEQKLLLEHEVIIFHHPFFWYSTPALLKEWQDLVLEHGWAYGRNGTALQGKIFFNVISTGGREDAYQTDGYNRFTIRELIRPLEQTARLCGMNFLPPFVIHGTHSINAEEITQHNHDYKRLLAAFCSGKINYTAAKKAGRLNEDLNSIINDDKE